MFFNKTPDDVDVSNTINEDLGLGAEKHSIELPAAPRALAYVKQWMEGEFVRLTRLQKALTDTASSNENAKACLATLADLMSNKPVSDPDLLNLAWTLLNLDLAGQLQAEKKKPSDLAKRLEVTHYADVTPMDEAVERESLAVDTTPNNK